MFHKLFKRWKTVRDEYKEEMLIEQEIGLEQIEQECQKMEEDLTEELLKDMRRYR
ncbi:MAG: hypothetical protein ACRC0X_01905 [Brevinema sp.]